MVLRNKLWKETYSDSHEKHGIPWTGIANASEGLKALANPQVVLNDLPFDPLEYIEHLDQLPFDRSLDPSIGQ